MSEALRRAAKLAAILATRDRDWLRAMCLGAVPGVEHARVLAQLDCRTIVDVGANRGQFALVARRCHPHARIVSFEPLPRPSAVFGRIFAGDSRVVLHQAAIGPSEQHTLMHVSASDDSSSLLPISPLQERVFPGTGEVGSAVVRVAPLSAFIVADELDGPALLKLDVQGYELDALRGCESLISSFRWVYCECSFVELYAGQSLVTEVIRWLVQRGYLMAGVFNTSFLGRGRAVQADFLFGRSDHVRTSGYDADCRDMDVGTP